MSPDPVEDKTTTKKKKQKRKKKKSSTELKSNKIKQTVNLILGHYFRHF